MMATGGADITPGTVTDGSSVNIERRDYVGRINALLQADDSKLQLIKDLVEEVEQQRERVSRLEFELEDEKDSKEKWRGRFLENSREAEKINHNPYVVLLLDGDGMLFTDNYLLQPQAGQTAAAALLQHTREVISNTAPELDTFETVIKVFGNVNGLVDLFKSRGLQPDFRNFVVGFSQSKPLVDFVNVGWGKEMADSKIFGELRFHLSNHNCKYVILGASHDNGYARVLGSLVVEGVDHDRILLLEGVPFGKEFKTLPFKKIKYPNMFHSQKVQNTSGRRQNLQTNSGASSVTSSAIAPTPKKTGGGRRTDKAQGLNMAPPPPYQPVQETFPTLLLPRQPVYPPPLPRPLGALLLGLSTIKPSLCSAHYLRGLYGGGTGCNASPGTCVHEHDRILTSEELQALGFLAQSRRCPQGLACTNPHCYNGHLCQVVGVCTRRRCAFKAEEHAPGAYKPAVDTSTTSDPQGESSSTAEVTKGEGSKGKGVDGQKSAVRGRKKRGKPQENSPSVTAGTTR